MRSAKLQIKTREHTHNYNYKLRKRIKVSIRAVLVETGNAERVYLCYQKAFCRLFSLLDTKILKQN